MTPKSNPGLITFKRKDKNPKYIDLAAIKFMEHFKVKRKYVDQIFGMLKLSKAWKKSTLKNDLERWKKFFPFKKATEIIDLVESSFMQCPDDEGINKLRGTITESIAIAYLWNKYNAEDYGWGAQVIVNKACGSAEVIKYNCDLYKYESCGKRSTIDVGYWSGYHGIFYECKITPKHFGCKEVQYLNTLHETLLKNSITHEIFLVTLYSTDAEEMNLNLTDYPPSFQLHLIDNRELKKVLSA
ncbi:MAG: hypothetical protein GX958_10545 [Desulfitobacterium sp.]|nr:hypothetical protein [Desulfitobacterium sp.]